MAESAHSHVARSRPIGEDYFLDPNGKLFKLCKEYNDVYTIDVGNIFSDGIAFNKMMDTIRNVAVKEHKKKLRELLE